MLKILHGVAGYEARCNDLIFIPAMSTATFKGSVIFFPGDVQDFQEVQGKHRDNVRYIKWSLEDTAKKLHHFFPKRNIVVIRPSRKQLSTFSCFDNFVQGDSMGNPTYSSDHNSLQHLSGLLNSIKKQIFEEKNDNSYQTSDAFGPLMLLGFSKGIVVLNQLIHELAQYQESGRHLPDNINLQRFVFMDGGHNGGPGSIYVTQENVLTKFVSYNIGVDLMVTPYQDKDSRRPWIHKESKSFVRLLTQLHAPVTKTLYFEEESLGGASIDTHFNIIDMLEFQTWDQE